MRDEIDGRLWVNHHQDFSRSLRALADAVRIAFRKLHEIQFDAPWGKKSSKSC